MIHLKLMQLLENNRANLYHATTLRNILNILDENRIEAKTTHTLSGVHYNYKSIFPIRDKSNPHVAQDGKIKGVSLTRSFAFARSWSEIILELDANKLKHNHKIINYSYYQTPNYDEAEEFIIGPINNLDKYLVSIYIPDYRYKALKSYDTTGYYKPLLKHPLLKISRFKLTKPRYDVHKPVKKVA